MKTKLSGMTPPDARSLALQIGAGRAIIAAAIMTAPVPAARALGADTATAQRVTWLTRMMAVRDGALGVGTVASVRGGRDAASWLIGGAVADALDALVIGAAVKQGRTSGMVPIGIVVGAAGSAAMGALTAVRLRRG